MSLFERLTLVLLWTLPALVAAHSESYAPIIHTNSGTLRGMWLPDGGAVFRGVPYAAAPVGALRWAPPAPAAGWHGIREATRTAPACTQPDQFWNKVPAATSNEDCLYLNIWTPQPAAAARLPVMVWIHGGGFVGGSGSEPIFDGDGFVARGVVLVTVNYRLGVFGFLAHPELTALSSDKSSGNYGLRDQIAALQWIKANITRFGGNPDGITLFGQSDGGASVMALLASPLSSALPATAIVESGAALRAIRTVSLADAEAIGVRFAAGASITELRRLATSEIMARFERFTKADPQMQMGPIVDGVVLPEDPQETFRTGREAPVPLIIGNNARENLARPDGISLPDAFHRTYGDQAQRAMALYGVGSTPPPQADPIIGDAGAQWMTDTTFRCGAVITAMRHAMAGHVVYEYQFEQPLPGRTELGAQHSFELPYVFGNLSPNGLLGGAFSPADRALSATLMGYWTNFAKRGDPNGAGLPSWPRFDTAGRAFIHFSSDLPGSAAADHGLRREQCALYEATLKP